MSLNCQGVYQCFHTCFQKLEDSHKTALSTNIQICGGSTMLSGKHQNLTKQFQGRSQKVPKGGAKSGKGNRERKIFAFFLCKRDQNRTKTAKMEWRAKRAENF